MIDGVKMARVNVNSRKKEKFFHISWEHIKLYWDHLMINTLFRTKREIYGENNYSHHVWHRLTFFALSSCLREKKIFFFFMVFSGVKNIFISVAITCPDLDSLFRVSQHVIIKKKSSCKQRCRSLSHEVFGRGWQRLILPPLFDSSASKLCPRQLGLLCW